MRSRWRTCGLVCMVLLCGTGPLGLYVVHVRREVERVRVPRTQSILVCLCSVALGREAHAPDKPTNDLINALRVTDEDLSLTMLERRADSATGQILDAWGRPIWWRQQQGTGPVLVSFGSNGEDENGQGDDIVQVCEFDPQ